MSNIVLTTHKRILGLPVKFSELQKGEMIVATNAPLGMLYTIVKDKEDWVFDYSEIEEEDLDSAIPLCLPLISDYKKRMKEDLTNALEDIQEIPE
jgi:hypothetical protein